MIKYVIIGAVLAVLIALGIICKRIVKTKGYPNDDNSGFAWGFFLNFIGLIVCLKKHPYVPLQKVDTKALENAVEETEMTSEEFAEKLSSTKSQEDESFAAPKEHIDLISDLHKTAISLITPRTSEDNNITVDFDTEWTKNIFELINQTQNIYSIIEAKCAQDLDENKIEYYQSLYERALTLSNLCRYKTEEVKTSSNQLTYYLKENETFKITEEAEQSLLNDLDTVDKLFSYLEKRRLKIKNYANELRKKISVECGEKGAQWNDQLD